MILFISFGFFIVCLIFGGITSWIFIRRSEKLHPELWRHAGEPTIMGTGDLISAWPLNKYLMNRDYLKVHDENARVFAEKLRLPFIASYFITWFAMILTVVSLLIVAT